MIRFLIAVIFVIIFLIVSIPMQLVELIVGLFSKKARAVSSQAMVSWAFRVILFITRVKIIVKGKEKIPTDRAVLYTPNHRSIFDVIIVYPETVGPTAFVAKQEIKKVPILNFWMMFMNCQFLDRKDLRKGLKVILKCVDLVKEGFSVTIFPEGTRNKTNEDLQPFRDGSLKIAEKSECPIVPIAINNTEQIFEAHMPFVKTATVVVEFCDPIYTDGLSREEKKDLSGKIQSEILEAYVRNKELVK